MSNQLPEILQGVLSDIGERLANGRDVGEELAELLPALHELAPSFIATRSCQITRAAGLYHRWRKPTWLERNFGKWRSEAEQLMNYPRLAELLIFHGDGYIREKAMQRIVGPLPSAFMCAAIMWRMNDWVPQVRSAAADCAASTFPKTDALVLAKAMGGVMIDQDSWGRWKVMPKQLQEALERPDVNSAVFDQIAESASGANTAVFRYALKTGFLDQQLPKIFESAIQPSLRALSFTALFDGEARWSEGKRTHWVDKPLGISRKVPDVKSRPLLIEVDKNSHLIWALNDRSPIVRRAAMTALIRHRLGSEQARELATSMLNDASKAVRGRAQFILSSERSAEQKGCPKSDSA